MKKLTKWLLISFTITTAYLVILIFNPLYAAAFLTLVFLLRLLSLTRKRR